MLFCWGLVRGSAERQNSCLQGLDNCVKLEELSFENNCLTKIDGLVRLTHLRRLSLGHNYITSLDDGVLERLTQLQYLSLENNTITSLAGLQRLSSLIELYLANNDIANIREVFYLKVGILPSARHHHYISHYVGSCMLSNMLCWIEMFLVYQKLIRYWNGTNFNMKSHHMNDFTLIAPFAVGSFVHMYVLCDNCSRTDSLFSELAKSSDFGSSW